MKSETYILANESVKVNACLRIKDIIADGKTKVTISDAGSKSGKQRALNWLWNSEVAESGLGGKHEDTKNGVHMVAKYRWAVPIFQRDDPLFADLYGIWVDLYGKDPERMMWFIDSQVHTEKMTVSQAAEFLTEYQRYYSNLGIMLTDPDDLKLLQYELNNGN